MHLVGGIEVDIRYGGVLSSIFDGMLDYLAVLSIAMVAADGNAMDNEIDAVEQAKRRVSTKEYLVLFC